jgi:hypothetical protein
MNEITEAKFEGYAIMELLGHRRLAGFVREATLAGAGVLRLDIPKLDAACWEAGTAPGWDEGNVTTYYSPASLYALTPVDGKTARVVARRTSPAPVSSWEIEEDARALLEAATEVPAPAPAIEECRGSPALEPQQPAVVEPPPMPAPAPRCPAPGSERCCDFAGELAHIDRVTKEPTFHCPKLCLCHIDEMPF